MTSNNPKILRRNLNCVPCHGSLAWEILDNVIPQRFGDGGLKIETCHVYWKPSAAGSCSWKHAVHPCSLLIRTHGASQAALWVSCLRGTRAKGSHQDGKFCHVRNGFSSWRFFLAGKETWVLGMLRYLDTYYIKEKEPFRGARPYKWAWDDLSSIHSETCLSARKSNYPESCLASGALPSHPGRGTHVGDIDQERRQACQPEDPL